MLEQFSQVIEGKSHIFIMAPRSLKLEHHDILIEDFDKNYTQACFFSSRARHLKTTEAKFSIEGREFSLNITINLTPAEGLVEVTLRRVGRYRGNQSQLFPIA